MSATSLSSPTSTVISTQTQTIAGPNGTTKRIVTKRVVKRVTRSTGGTDELKTDQLISPSASGSASSSPSNAAATASASSAAAAVTTASSLTSTSAASTSSVASESKSDSFDFDEDTKKKTQAVRSASALSIDVKGRAPTEVFCVQFSPDSRYLTCGCGDGTLRVWQTNGKLVSTIYWQGGNGLPTTAIRFRPQQGSSATNKNSFIAANADGNIQFFNVSSATRLHSIEEQDNQIYALDYNKGGTQFASAGRDTKVRLYDEETKTLVRVMSTGKGKSTSGHSNRIYSLKWTPSSKNASTGESSDLLLSAGWDNTVQFWDTRMGNSVRSVYGPHVCGDALDVSADGKYFITGSWLPNDALVLWDFGTGKEVAKINWQGTSAKNKNSKTRPVEMLYSCQYSPDNTSIAAAGSGTNEIKVFNMDSTKANLYDYTVCSTLNGKAIYSLAWAPGGSSSQGNKLAYGGADRNVMLIDLANSK